MTDTDRLEEISREINKTIEENKRFLNRILDDDFEPEDDEEGDEDLVEF
jgi:hypothetical protein